MTTLFPYQEAAVTQALAHDSWCCSAGMGLGKTLMATTFIKRKGDVKTVVVVCPLITFASWERTIESELPGTPVRQLRNDKANVANFGLLAKGEPGWYLLGIELMRTGVVTGVSVDAIIADENHFMANRKSLQHKMMKHFTSRYKIALSGTPAGNKAEGIYGTLSWLWPKQYKSYWKFVEQYFRTRRTGQIIEIVREITPGALVRDIPMYTRLRTEDHRGDIPKRLPEIPVAVDLTVTQQRVYDKLAEEAGVWLEDEFMSTSVSLVQNLRLRELCLAVPSIVDDSVTFKPEAKSSKIDALIQIVEQEENKGQTLLVFTHSAKIVPLVVARLLARGIKAAAYTGTDKADLSVFGTGYQVLVATIAAMGTGVDGLQAACSRMIWLSKHPSAIENQQAAYRLDRPGQKFPVAAWNLYVPGTVDEQSLERLEDVESKLKSVLDNRTQA